LTSGLSGRRVLLGITGGIAAYKTPDLVRRLQKVGCEVRCVLTHNAARLVAPAALSALTRFPVSLEVFGDDDSVYTRHIDTAIWADAYVVAPATANTLARFTAGLADDPVALAWLTVQGPKLLCPSMNTRMLDAPATRRNLSVLAQDGAHVLWPDDGALACGETGPGRLPDADQILSALAALFAPKARKPLRILLTAGRTEEPIDDVRVLTNQSSGRTGAAIAEEAIRRGHNVTVIAGPMDAALPAGAKIVRVRTSLEMHAAALAQWPAHDAAICAAAVADFRPAQRESGKIAASREMRTLELVPNPDILGELCGTRHAGTLGEGGQKVVGFALETTGLERGSQKLSKKGADLAVCNDPLADPTTGGFGKDRTWAWIGPAGQNPSGEWMPKSELARRILSSLEAL
jgi:phosphopantothenoylcysteine decarboxylase/phosphopantothenate--cysteine ligase